jgi:hypothetical protein
VEPSKIGAARIFGETTKLSYGRGGSYRAVSDEADPRDWIIEGRVERAGLGSLAWSHLFASFHQYSSEPVQLHAYEDVLPRVLFDVNALHDVELVFAGDALVGETYDTETAELFTGLAEEWKHETLVESSLTALVMHRAYQNIIGLGPRAIPFILRELEQEPNHWFWALAAITREDPAEGEETLDGAAEKWLEWGRMRGYI